MTEQSNRLALISKIKGILNGTATIKPILLHRASNGLLYDDSDLEAVMYVVRFNSEHEFNSWKTSAGLSHASYSVSNNPPLVTCILKTEYVPLPGAIQRHGKSVGSGEPTNPTYKAHREQLNALAQQYAKNPPKYFTIERGPFSSCGAGVNINGKIMPVWLR